jgi:hypothetical protein
MTPQSAKAKGRLLQQLVRKRLIEVFNLSPEDVKSTSMGASGEDIQLSSYARSRIPISIECKSRHRHTVYHSYWQAVDNSNGNIPVLIVKQNNASPLAVLDLEHFLSFVKKSLE